MKNRYRIVVDTNIFLTSISRKSNTHWLFQKFINDEFDLCLTNDVLTEYEEIMTKKLPASLKNYVIDILLLSRNVIKVI